MIEIFESYEPISSDEVYQLEQKIGIPIPESYQEFLCTYNGGYPEPSGFIYIENNTQCLGSVNRFLGIHSGRFSNLLRYLEIYKGKNPRIPSDLIPIANDPGGNLICMSIFDDNLGKIYFWDHDYEAAYDPILRTNLGGYSPVIKQVLVVGMVFNQSWVQLKHFSK